MGVIRQAMMVALLCTSLCFLAARDASAQGASDAARTARWTELQHAIFPGRSILDGSAVIEMEAPLRALDAALVPITLSLKGGKMIKGVYLVIDENPGPLAGHFAFGPDADPRMLKLRVRVNAYTNIHAVAETGDGKLYSVAKFVKAAGGCSAPAGADDGAALQDIGRMKLKLLDSFVAGKPIQAQLMIRHPNFNGMQMNQTTRLYTAARFIRSIDVSYDGGLVLHLDSDISLSTDPVITFGFLPRGKGKLTVVVLDTSEAKFGASFDVPASAG